MNVGKPKRIYRIEPIRDPVPPLQKPRVAPTPPAAPEQAPSR
jgi:hypothetical protein